MGLGMMTSSYNTDGDKPVAEPNDRPSNERYDLQKDDNGNVLDASSAEPPPWHEDIGARARFEAFTGYDANDFSPPSN